MAYVNLGQVIYPVGSVYHSFNTISPASIFGGSWSALNNQFLLSSNGNINTTGGEWNHTLTAREIPDHKHAFAINIQHTDGETVSGEALTSGLQLGGRRRYFGVTHTTDDTAVGGEAHNNMPPYITCRIWKRTA